MSEPLVSVCINTYNKEKFICDCIDSVLAQSYGNIEVIIVDDGSKDNTVSLINEKFNDSRIKVFARTQNMGISYSCNEAIKHSLGEYIFHVDSDDVLDSQIIKKQVDILEKNPQYGACFCLLEVIGENGEKLGKEYDYIRDTFSFWGTSQEDYIRYFFDSMNCLSHSGVTMRRSVLEKVGGHNGAYYYLHDFDLWTRFILECPVYVIKENLCSYRRTDDGNNSKISQKGMLSHNIEEAKIIYNMINNCPDEMFLRAFDDKLILHGEHTHEETELEKAFVLMEGLWANRSDKILGLLKLSELFCDEKYVLLAFEKFNFTYRDLLNLEDENDCFDYINNRTISEQNNKIEILTAQNEQLQNCVLETRAIVNFKNRILKFSLVNYCAKAAKLALNILRGIKSLNNIRGKDGKKYGKKVMLYGYYRMNLGDDLFFDTLLKRYPNTLFVIYFEPQYREFFDKYPNTKYYSSFDSKVARVNKLSKVFKKTDLFEHILIKKCDAVIHIGGSIYQEVGDWKLDHILRLNRLKKGRPFFSVSSNFGTYESDEFFNLWKNTFRQYYDICFRDKYSYELFSDVNSVRYAPDVLFSYKADNVTTEKDSVCISVIDPYLSRKGVGDKSGIYYTNAILSSVTELINLGKKVTLLGFCSYENDSEYIDKLLKYLPLKYQKSVKVINYRFDNMNEIINALSSCEYILATRLHSIILGLCFGKKVLPVVYNDKIKNILDDIAFDGKRIGINEINELNCNNIVNSLLSQKVFDIEKIKPAADKQFEKLDLILK